MLYILWGEDEYSLAENLQEIKNTLKDVSLLDTNTHNLDGLKISLNELKSVVEATPFLAAKRLVIVKGLLARFEPKEKNTQPKKDTTSSTKQDEAASFANCLRGIPESTILVLIDNIDVKKPFLQKNLLFTAIAEVAEVKRFPALQGAQLEQWIQSRVDKQSCGISRQAINLLERIVGGDLYTMSNEINKLVSFTSGRMIEEKDIRAVVSASQEADIFAMVDAIIDNQVATAEQILQKLLQNGVVPPQILALIASQLRTLVQVKELKSLKKSSAEIQSKLGIFKSFIWVKVSRRSEKYSLDRLKEIYQRILETDLSIKTGRFEGDLALNILVADLCEKQSRK